MGLAAFTMLVYEGRLTESEAPGVVCSLDLRFRADQLMRSYYATGDKGVLEQLRGGWCVGDDCHWARAASNSPAFSFGMVTPGVARSSSAVVGR